jgi:hypothetical protein
VTGVVDRVKVPNVIERDVVRSDQSIETVMLSIECARRLVTLHGETAATYFRDDQTVITTTTTNDSILKELDWVEELEIVRRFGPDYHIPTEYSVYKETMSLGEQGQAIADCMRGTEWVAERLGNHSTDVFVQAKGWLPWHFEMCRPTMRRLETDFVVFYATGYEARVAEPVQDLETLVSVLNPSGVLVIGQQSVRFLSQTTPEVVAAAGYRWRKESGLEDGRHEPQMHKSWKRGVEQELDAGQTILSSFSSTTVKEHG